MIDGPATRRPSELEILFGRAASASGAGRTER